jgi:hypothetical protein
MAWKTKKFKVVKIGSGMDRPLEFLGAGFDSFEEAEQDLAKISSDRIAHYTILPVYIFEPERFE